MASITALFWLGVVFQAYNVYHVLSQELTHCPDGWTYFQGSCYHFEENLTLDWTESTHYCQSHHAHLVTIQSREEDLFIAHFATRLSTCITDRIFWAGGSDSIIEGVWTWYTDDSRATYTNWDRGQPDPPAHDQDCLCLHGSFGFTWHDETCTNSHHPICELELDIETIPSVIG